MKTTAFKVFAPFVVVLCLASPPVTRASPLLNSRSSTSKNPIVEKLVGQNVVDLKPYDSMLIANEVVQKPAMAVNDPMVPQELHRQRRSFDPEEEKQMMDEHDNGSISEDSTETVSELPDPSNEDSEQSNEVQNSQESNEVQNSRESNEIQDSQESNEIQNSQQSGEEYNVPQGLPDPHSYESEEGSYESEGNTNDSSVSTDNSSVSDDSMYSDDDNEEFIITTTTSPLLQT